TKAEHGLRWDLRSSVLKGGEKGPPIVPGKPAESLMIRAVNGGGEDIPAMPKKGDPLTSAQIDLLRTWIAQGAHWPDSAAGATASAKDPKDHWAFKAPVRPA